ncbi:LuxR family transcriptional regulator [uncultured Jannaschia sp.]|uniref:helix-turn-helix transcriptional regulator n=1 Tax=uncultured Jannaschia sp. TaxID=293347 RepID=UPI0026274F0E|nr:LuxR family transcriptional regulator [uncultured Jannaschia sp.]
MPDDNLTTYSNDVTDAPDGLTLWRMARKFLRARGIVRMSYHFLDPTGGRAPLVRAEGFPEDWVAHYVKNDLADIDPIPALAARRTKPFFWSELETLVKLTPEERAFVRELETAHLGDGLAMQVYGPRMRSAYVGLGFGGPRPELSEAQIFELKSAVQLAHLRYCELDETRPLTHRELSPRETEILSWIARGKSNSVMAEILGVSRHTVDTLVRRIFQKLEVGDRTTAVLRGLGAGLIVLDRRMPVTQSRDVT